jgi:glycosyltransferase involved in cell wall biosynthesis
VTVYFLFRDSPDRRAALATPGALDRYRLFGLDELRARGIHVRHNLERGKPPLWARALATVVNAVLRACGGYGGDFASVLGSLRHANRADVVFATADTVGIPLILLKRLGLVRPPVVYTSIGLPERLVQLRNVAMRRLYGAALRRAAAVVVYAQSEADWLSRWLASSVPHVVFVPFGVDVSAFAPHVNGASDADVVSVGADPRRDFRLLTSIASRHPELRFGIVAASSHALGPLPPNVAVERDVPLERVRERLAGARVVALPVRRNSYSGATTVLLQAMALGKPVVVSGTDAIVEGYGLADGVNCRLVAPGDEEAFERALLETLADPQSLGLRARETVEPNLSWARYTDTISDILSAACTPERT